MITSVEVAFSLTTDDTASIALPQTNIPELTIRGTNFFPSTTGPMVTIRRAGYPDRTFIGPTTNQNGGTAEDGWIKVRDIDLRGYATGSFDVVVTRHPANPGSAAKTNAFRLRPHGPDRIESVGAWGGPVDRVQVEGNRIYVSAGRRLIVLDSTDESSLVELGAIDLKTSVLDFVVREGYAFVCTRTEHVNQFCVVEVGAGAPRVVWTSRGLGQAWRTVEVELFGNTAYVRLQGDSILRFDISTPSAPVHLGTLGNVPVGTSLYPGDYMRIDSGRLYVVRDAMSQPVLRIYDLAASAAAPPLLGELVIDSDAIPFGTGAPQLKGFDVQGSYVLASIIKDVTPGTNRYAMLAIDVSNPASPALVSTTLAPDRAGMWWAGVAVGNGLAAVAEYEQAPIHPDPPIRPDDDIRGLLLYDTAANPSAPALLATVKTHGSIYDVEIVGNRAYVFDLGEGLIVLDISNPAQPVRLGGYYSPASLREVAINGDLLYISDEWNGFTILDVADPATPRVVGVYQTPGTNKQDHRGIAYRGGLVYLGAGYGGVDVVDVSNPAAPVRIGNYSSLPPGATWARVWGLELDGALLRVAAKVHYPGFVPDELWNLALTDPVSMTLLGSLAGVLQDAMLRTISGITYATDEATTANTIRLIDNRNPAAPAHLGTITGADLAVAGSTMYTCSMPTAENKSLLMWDVADPAAPAQTGQFDLDQVIGPGIGDAFGAVAVDSGKVFAIAHLRPLDGSPAATLQMFEPLPGPPGLRPVASLGWEPLGGPASVPLASRLFATPNRVYAVQAFAPRDPSAFSSGREVHGLVIVDRYIACLADYDGDGSLTPADIAAFVAVWFTSLSGGSLGGDFDGDGAVRPADVAAFVSAWFNEITAGECR